MELAQHQQLHTAVMSMPYVTSLFLHHGPSRARLCWTVVVFGPGWARSGFGSGQAAVGWCISPLHISTLKGLQVTSATALHMQDALHNASWFQLTSLNQWKHNTVQCCTNVHWPSCCTVRDQMSQNDTQSQLNPWRIPPPTPFQQPFCRSTWISQFPLSFFFHLFRNRTYGYKRHSYLMGQMTSCHPTTVSQHWKKQLNPWCNVYALRHTSLRAVVMCEYLVHVRVQWFCTQSYTTHSSIAQDTCLTDSFPGQPGKPALKMLNHSGF